MDAAIARKSLEKHLARLRPTERLQPPAKGWVRAIRDALGMTAVQLANRMKISQPSVVALEKDEAKSTVTLARLERAAEAMDCTLVYALVPNRPLEDIVMERARQRADKLLARVNHTMALEMQNLDAKALIEERDDLATELLRENIRRLWDEK